MKANIYKIHYENGSHEIVVAQSEKMVSECCEGVNQISNIAEGARVLEGKWKDDEDLAPLSPVEPPQAVEPISEEKQAEELLASVPTATAGESQ